MTSSTAQFDTTVQQFEAVRAQIAQTIIGQADVIDQVLITVLSGGHGLLIGVPGLGKTLLVKTTAQALGLLTSRVQCTPDLMPSDVTGTEILDTSQDGPRHFRFVKGPVFSQLLMIDEINRASPKTQSALLEAMQEKFVTVGGTTHALPTPFHVLATQNPIEQEGTYPLPEAQLDRFLMEISMTYPDKDAEYKMVLNTTRPQTQSNKPVLKNDDLQSAQQMIQSMPVGEKVANAMINLVRSARPDKNSSNLVNENVLWAPGPRASQALMMATRARALLQGRTAPSVDDIIALAKPVLRHRMRLKPRARSEGITTDLLIETLIAGI